MTRPRKEREPRPGTGPRPTQGAPSASPTAVSIDALPPASDAPGAIAEAEGRGASLAAPGAAPAEPPPSTEPTAAADPGEPAAPAVHRPVPRHGDRVDDRRQPPPHPAPSVTVTRGSWATAVAAGAAAALVVAAAAWWLLGAELRRPDGALLARLDGIDRRLGELEATRAEARAVAQRLPGVEAQVSQESARIDALGGRLETLAAERPQAATAAAPAVPPALEGRLADLAARIAALPTREADLAPLTAAGEATRADLASLRGELAALRGELAKIPSELAATAQRSEARTADLAREAGAARAALDTRLMALDQRLERLRLVGERAPELALAIDDAAAALARDASLAPALDRLGRITEGDTALTAQVDALRTATQAGLMPLAELRARLDRVAAGTGGSEVPAAVPTENLLGQAVRNLGRLVTVEPIDAAADPVRTAVASARQRLAAGDVQGARDALAPTARAGNEAAAAWIAAAQPRLTAEAAIAGLRARLAALLATAI